MSEQRLTEHAEMLHCVECAATTTDGDGWRGILAVGDEDAEDVEEVAVYCPECAARGVRRAVSRVVMHR